ncbi:RNase adapter RapZ [Oerskovia enterophila]|uniref:GlmZ(SRNA)-inactivating NTPase n=1 Tax=Oerskovia enterophila TaxID=43678 RepID=A0ABX2Y821_9CELL|nr:RNase adapter RapZ [Oerskovia enterophila]OCI32743.1 glmZ(sRNA)-inactivating NTPase [Oerskovia enterophila]
MSGAGRTRAAAVLEDLDWYVVDNMPPKMLVPLVDMMTRAGPRPGTSSRTETVMALPRFLRW